MEKSLKWFWKHRSVVLCALAVFFTCSATNTAEPLAGVGVGGTRRRNDLAPLVGKGLRFSGLSFRIALFADLHYGENAWDDWGPEQDVKSDKVQSIVLDKEMPDFVIYLGDLITANNLPIHNASLYWDRAISPTRGKGIPWAILFGNHDDASFEWPLEWFSSAGIPDVHCPFAGGKSCSFRGTMRMELVKEEIENNILSHSQCGPTELWPGISNYILQISSSKDPDLPSVFLYFLDSGGGSYPEVISFAQVKWFKEKSRTINPDARIPELIFWHIPSKAYKKVGPHPKSRIRSPCSGSINDEEVASQEVEWGMIDVLINRSSVKAVFVGHNHGLDWCCPYKSLWLCFARHTAYGGYGNWAQGARILEMKEDPFTLTSWLRMEDGSSHSYVKLSS
ncbi:hypothetical protein HPP92_014176 [Vanilla planifolia]|uniref:Calcineurin-like phosphoesterase domain-containing protein n=1 Tax=Vanilla planifolia TaxID=51239 RepID=A0A835QPS6_VANPL|nr:hypothetical protein HPP92_014176 [Vanilla planifolia]